MHIKLTPSNWDMPQLAMQEEQKDYDNIEEDRAIIFIYGYPFNASKKSWILADDVYQSYLNTDLDFIEDIDGVYTIVILDKEKEICHVITDRYGVYSLFFWRNDDSFIISDYISEIIPYMSKPRLNLQSVIEYLNFGFKLGNKTHIEGVFEFEGAKAYQIDKDLKMNEKAYWKLLGKIKENKISNDEIRKMFNAHIKTALNLEKRISLPLSGGLDSRAILSACLPQKERLHCFTFGMKKIPDVKIAQKICSHFKIRHTYFELNEEWIKNIPYMFKRRANDFNGLIPAKMILSKDFFKDIDKTGDILITGVFGNEIWRGLLGGQIADNMDTDEIIDVIMRIYARFYRSPFDIHDDYSNKDILDIVRKSVKKELMEPKGNIAPIHRFELFVFRNWCPNWGGNALKAVGRFFKVFPAFLNKDLLQQLPLIDREEKINGSIQKHIVLKNDSYLANQNLDVLDMRHGAFIRNDYTGKVKALQVMIPAYFKIAGNIASKRLFRREIFRTSAFTDWPNWLRKYNQDFIREVFDYDKMVTKGLYNKKGFEEIIRLSIKGDDYLAYILIRFINFELWMRYLNDNRKSGLLTVQIPQLRQIYA